MSSEIAGAVQSVRLLWDVVKANKTLANYNELVSAVSEVNTDLIAAQSVAMACQKEQLTLTKRVGELEKEITELKNFEREAERYQLTEIAPGIPARVLKPGMEQGEHAHQLCANCFARNKKSFLQVGPHSTGMMQCSECRGQWFPADTTHIPTRVVGR